MAVTLFGPAGAAGVARVLKSLAAPVHRAEDPVFGWVDRENLRGEGTPRPWADVLLTGTTRDGSGWPR